MNFSDRNGRGQPVTGARMSDTTTTDVPAEPTEPAPEQQAKPTETVEFWKQKAREQESRAKANKAAADELATIRESQKSETQKTAERLAQLEQESASARREALRWKVAAKHGIGNEDAELFLTGADEETLTRQAERLAVRESDRKKQGNHVPHEGRTPTAGSDGAREVVRGLFGG